MNAQQSTLLNEIKSLLAESTRASTEDPGYGVQLDNAQYVLLLQTFAFGPHVCFVIRSEGRPLKEALAMVEAYFSRFNAAAFIWALPDELLSEVLREVDPMARRTLVLVCRRGYNVVIQCWFSSSMIQSGPVGMRQYNANSNLQAFFVCGLWWCGLWWWVGWWWWSCFWWRDRHAERRWWPWFSWGEVGEGRRWVWG
ncbi:hypothetical protein BDV98DRAFT_314505 [Pterulicium gracile]|uniref:F-box domain-containing protein n=1 Tax=Pterulicium gracile TaxID=1884261 RepID=A0A5C3QQV8_9AGAR|nr:hypothetical protein BDV98DRAFT_314505 [Pterula gracilis]